MFKVNGHKAIVKDLHKIVDNKLVLFNDRSNDVLFTGTNIYTNRILACIMFEDDEDDFLRYYQVVTTEEQYVNFINRRLSLRKILEDNENFFLVDYSYSMEEIDYNVVSFHEVPNEFLPLENSLCPSFVQEPSFAYSLSMQGGLSDLHKTKSKDLSIVSNKFSDLLKSATNFLDDLDISRNIYIEGLEAGSFKINFKVEIDSPDQLGLINIPTEQINNFLNEYFNYFFNDLPEEDENIFREAIVSSDKFKDLEQKLELLYADNFVVPQAGVEQKLIDLINYSVDSIKEIEYNESFNSLKFENITASGQAIPFAIINEDFIPSIENIVYNVDQFNARDIIEVDQHPQNYNVRVYDFSTISGKGSGFFYQPDGQTWKIIIHATGKDNYENTIFTKSMDEGQPYIFRGIGTRKNGKLKKVVYTYL